MKRFSLLCVLVLLFTSTRAQTFTVIDTLPPGVYGGAAWGDFDHDGFKDLIYITQGITGTNILTVYHNVSNTFVPIAQALPFVYNPMAKWADLNNDGFDDLVLFGFDSTFHNRAYIFKSNGDGTFAEMPNTLVGASFGGVDVADYNNDGLKDIAVAGDDSVHAGARIYKNLGSFNFIEINAHLVGTDKGEVKWGDFNGDGKADLVVNGLEPAGNASARIYENMGADSFSLLPLTIQGSIYGAVDWIDYDNDGHLDLLVKGVDSGGAMVFSHLYHNDGGGAFSQVITNLPLFGESSGACVADFNNDGFPDVCFAGGFSSPVNSAVCLGNGTATYTVNGLVTLSHGAEQATAIAADIDNDGDQDILVSNLILRNDHITGIPSVTGASSGIHVMPNPASDEIRVELAVRNIVIAIYDGMGRQVYTSVYRDSPLIIDTHDFANGVYLLKAGDNALLTQKLVINR